MVKHAYLFASGTPKVYIGKIYKKYLRDRQAVPSAMVCATTRSHPWKVTERAQKQRSPPPSIWMYIMAVLQHTCTKTPPNGMKLWV